MTQNDDPIVEDLTVKFVNIHTCMVGFFSETRTTLQSTHVLLSQPASATPLLAATSPTQPTFQHRGGQASNWAVSDDRQAKLQNVTTGAETEHKIGRTQRESVRNKIIA